MLNRCLASSSAAAAAAALSSQGAAASSLRRLQQLQARTLAAVPLSLVKELRSASGAPITDCKKALEVRVGVCVCVFCVCV